MVPGMSRQRKKSAPSDGGGCMAEPGCRQHLAARFPHPEYHAPPQKKSVRRRTEAWRGYFSCAV